MATTMAFTLLGQDKLSPAMKSAERSTDSLGHKLGGFGRIAGIALAATAGAAGALAGAGAVLGIKTAASLEQANIAFTTLLGSGQKAQTFLSGLAQFAAKTPFELPGLIDASRLLLGVGLNAQDVVPMLQDFGDAASAVGVGQDAFQRIMLATSQAISAGRFQVGDLNQIMTNGIPVWTILSKSMHKSVPELRDMASHGKLLAKDVLPALQSQMHKDYGGAMQAQSQTLNGIWSTFMDTLSLGLANVIQPLIPAMKTGLTNAIGVLGTVLAAVPGIADKVFGALGHVKDGVVALWHLTSTGDFNHAFAQAFHVSEDSSFVSFLITARDTVIDVFGKIRTALRDNGPEFRALGKSALELAGWFADKLQPPIVFIAQNALPALGTAVTTVVGAIGWLTRTVQDHTTTAKVLGGLIAAVFIPHWIALGVAATTSGISQARAWAVNTTAGIRGAAMHSVSVVRTVAGWVAMGVAATASGITSARIWAMYAADSIRGAATQAVSAARVVGGWVLMGVQSLLNAGRMAAAWFIALGPVGWVIGALIAVGIALVALWKKSDTFRRIVTGAFEGVKTAVSTTVDWFKQLPGRIADAIGDTASWLYEKGKGFLTGLMNGIMAVASGIGAWMLRAPIVKVITPWLYAGVWLVAHGKKLIEGLKKGVLDAIGAIATWTNNFVIQPLVRPWINANVWLYNKGAAFVTGLKNGIVSIAKTIGTWVNTNVIQPTIRVFTNAGTWLYTKGAAFVTGLKNGIISISRTIGTWVNTNVIQPTIRVFTNAGTWLYTKGSALVTGFKTGIVSVAKSIGGWVNNNVISPVTRGFSTAGTWLKTAGSNIIGGLKSGVAGAVKNIGSWVKTTIVDPIVKNVKSFFGIKSPSTVMAAVGKYLIQGLFKGMGSGWGGAVAKKVFGDMPKALGALVGKGLVGLANLPKKAIDALIGTGADFIVPGNIGVLNGPNRRVFYQGEALDYSTYLKLKRAEQMVGHAIHVTQGSYERASSFSGTTHTGGGVLDVSRGNLQLYQKVLRAVGFAAWDRTGKGNWAPHVHGVEIGNRLAAASAQGQVRDYMRGGDGLAGNASTRKSSVRLMPAGFREGGWWMPGMLGVNETSRPEAVFNEDQLKMMGSESIDYGKLARAIAEAVREGRPINVEQNFPAGGNAESAANAAVDRLLALLGG